ncbi:MAG: ATP-dependent sacrificial sulfur transferase LarE [Eubacterium sp.]|nr:ATP-dependent sacrificial sulfur transferase LarE [Eubacterium sp.]
MSELKKELRDKLERLQGIVKEYDKPCIAFSGGVDSSFLLKASAEVMGGSLLAITANGGMMPRSEYDEAMIFAKSVGAHLHVIDVDVFSEPAFVENGSRRCYFCKKNIFTQIKGEAQEQGCDVIFDGSNLDDLKDYRPGLAALEEMMIVSPMIEAGMTKQDIRDISAWYGLSTAAKPAMACLATRIPTGEEINRKKLLMVEQGEACLKILGLSQYRLRYMNGIAKIECPPENFPKLLAARESLIANLKVLGFETITLDLEGYGCGRMNGGSKDEH